MGGSAPPTGPRTSPLPPLTLRRGMLIAAGGALGAGLRWGLAETGPAPTVTGLPWVVLGVNVLGAALLAAALQRAARRPERRSLLVDGVGTGFCGGLTTFSTFAVGVAEQLRSGEVVWALATVVVMVAAGLTAAALTARRLEPRKAPP